MSPNAPEKIEPGYLVEIEDGVSVCLHIPDCMHPACGVVLSQDRQRIVISEEEFGNRNSQRPDIPCAFYNYRDGVFSMNRSEYCDRFDCYRRIFIDVDAYAGPVPVFDEQRRLQLPKGD